MNLEQQSDVVLTLGQVLHVNGQSTDDTLAAAERLSKSIGLHATIIPGTYGTPESRNHAGSAQPGGCEWAGQGSNLRPWD